MKLAQTRQLIRDDIAVITPFDDIEREQIADTLSWIDSGTNIFRIEAPDKPLKHLVAYFVLIDPEHSSVLLGDHIKAQLWLPSGGHVELNELPVDTVRREIVEELYMLPVFLRNNKQPFFLTQTQTVGLTPGHTDVSMWYLLRGDVHAELNFDRTAYTDMNWFGIQEILDSHPSIFDAHMHRFTRKLASYLHT